MYEYFDTIEEAQSRAKEVYPNKTFPLSLGCAWTDNGFISMVENKYILYTDL
ncbi:hypothetical protein CRP7_gp39 [Roseobacter phage CRP-7]|nr:hypothetical protein CRP7_gp39 [Roseobacter phage CRP-7]